MITLSEIQKAFGDSNDFGGRDIMVGKLRVSVVFVDGLTSGNWIAEEIVRPLTQHDYLQKVSDPEKLLERMQDGGIYNHECKRRDTAEDVISDLINASAAVIVEGGSYCLTFEARGYASRGLGESSGESVQKGAKDSFIENIRTNTALVRRKLKNPNLRISGTVVGRQSQTPIAVVYIEGIANDDLVTKVKQRIDSINIDALLSASQIEEYISDNKLSAFPQLVYTERVDKFCSGLVAGRVGILIDGLPISYIVPGTLAQFLHAPEDYSQSFFMASGITLLRYISLLISLSLPALYLAIVNFHQEMIPTALAQSIIEAKQNVPLASVFEVIGMLIAFEILLEAGMRLPKPIGQAVSIVGGLVVGQAAVEAKFVSPVVVIVVALTGIAGFTSPNPDLSGAIRVWRIALTVLAATSGLYGFSLGAVLLIYHLCCVESFDVPYLSPAGTGNWRDALTRTLIRPPMWLTKRREKELRVTNERNQG